MAERQLAKSLDRIRADHVARYRWAAERIGRPAIVADIGCGCGYGARMLADAGHSALGIDVDAPSIKFARIHWDTAGLGGTTFRVQDAAALTTPVHVAVMFEVIEHLADPLPALVAARRCARRLLYSVPNEDVIPFNKTKFPYHHRHYRAADVEALLVEAGWSVVKWWGQSDKTSPVEPKRLDGRTLVLECAPA